jgi:hypothetical protein
MLGPPGSHGLPASDPGANSPNDFQQLVPPAAETCARALGAMLKKADDILAALAQNFR